MKHLTLLPLLDHAKKSIHCLRYASALMHMHHVRFHHRGLRIPMLGATGLFVSELIVAALGQDMTRSLPMARLQRAETNGIPNLTALSHVITNEAKAYQTRFRNDINCR